MTKKALLGLLAYGGLASLISCDSAQPGTSANLDVNDCPVGTFRPVGLTDCVFPSSDVNNQPIGVSDNRCAQGQPAVPPQCVGENGERAYLASSTKCAPDYRYLPGACNRNGGFFTGAAGSSTGVAAGVAGDFGTGFGVGAAGEGGGAGATGAAGMGVVSTGAAGDPGTGAGGSLATGAAGAATGAAGDAVGGAGGT